MADIEEALTKTWNPVLERVLRHTFEMPGHPFRRGCTGPDNAAGLSFSLAL